MENLRRTIVGLVIVPLLLALWLGAPTPLRADHLPQALPLGNPGFESPYHSGVAHSWAPWHEDSGEQKCGRNKEPWDFACRPSWGEEVDYGGHGLTRGGLSQHVGVQYKPWHAGVFQTLSVAPGTRVRFSAWGRAFASNDDLPKQSFAGWNSSMRVGIDPEGRGLWYDAGIVWSAPINPLDTWQQASVEATAGASGNITVYVSADFRNQQPLKHLDVWWDEASLAAVSPPAEPTSPPPPPRPTNTPGPSPTPLPTPTPRPDGAIVHIVQSGDTLLAIALRYGVPLEQVRQLNAGSIGAGDIIVPGQELVIAIPSETPTPTPPPTPLASPTPETGSVCVLAFHDRSGDTFRQTDAEEMLPNAVFSLGGTSGLVGQYTTDGLGEPYCFTGLTPGSYRLVMQPPPGYVASGSSELALVLGAAGTMDVAFGAQRGEAPESGTPAEGEPGEGRSTWSNVLRWAAGVSGVLVLVAAVVIGVFYFLSRRR